MSLISVMVSVAIASIVLAATTSIISSSLKSQKLIERRALKKDLFNHYITQLSNEQIKNFTIENSANPTLKNHINGIGTPQPLTVIPADFTSTPSPLYPSTDGITVYKTASIVLIPKTGLLLKGDGATCTPSPCTSNQAKWKILVKWAALSNQSYDFYLSISDVNTTPHTLRLKPHERMLKSSSTNAAFDLVNFVNQCPTVARAELCTLPNVLFTSYSIRTRLRTITTPVRVLTLRCGGRYDDDGSNSSLYPSCTRESGPSYLRRTIRYTPSCAGALTRVSSRYTRRNSYGYQWTTTYKCTTAGTTRRVFAPTSVPSYRCCS